MSIHYGKQHIMFAAAQSLQFPYAISLLRWFMKQHHAADEHHKKLMLHDDIA